LRDELSDFIVKFSGNGRVMGVLKSPFEQWAVHGGGTRLYVIFLIFGK
jgi:hypothetical protein